MAILVDLTTDGRPEGEEEWLNRFGHLLTEEESAVLRYAAHVPRRKAALQRTEEAGTSTDVDVAAGGSGTTPVIGLLAELAERYRNTITELLNAVGASATSSVEDADIDGEETAVSGEMPL
ncbi:hypothetical protein [Streptomyces sp. NBC_01244]|uniref:hypothetical protein n=1 Tax=Streptomyces sp. NBC_01244 TaxID=2903797 RepID=UPI002E137DC8|nr:hypothetical protein OG247_34500 [Streptomyces sp. NBC_01244]